MFFNNIASISIAGEVPKELFSFDFIYYVLKKVSNYKIHNSTLKVKLYQFVDKFYIINNYLVKFMNDYKIKKTL